MRNQLILTLAAAALAALSSTAPAMAQTASAATPVKEKKVCRRQEVTGSILGTKAVCHTRSEWQTIDRTNEDGASRTLDRDRQQQNSGVGNTRNGG